MNIIEKYVNELIPYANNPRKNEKAVSKVAESIKEFGFKVPVVIDANDVIVCGHTRVKAAKLLDMDTVPCVVADDLTDEQIRAFRIADNKTSEFADWDFEALNIELENIESIDMGELFDANMRDFEAEHEENHNEMREKVENILNLGIEHFAGDGEYGIPFIYAENDIPEIKEWIGFNYVMSDNEPAGKGVHFFIDDYQFERIWNNPEKYVEKLKQYAVVASPDFSPYGNMPMALQIFNHYRKHWVGAFLQSRGVRVIPTIRASTHVGSLKWYLDGEPKDGTVIFSSMWCGSSNEFDDYTRIEFETMVEKLHPRKIFIYGKMLEWMNGNHELEHIESFTQKRWSKEVQ